jgi:hypothetical protein
MPCIDCQHSALRDAKSPERDRSLGRMAKLGFVNCLRSNLRASFHPFHHTCAGWAEASEQVTAGRRAWLAKTSEGTP